jgi:Skp family chaperone for outer membrane proteins
MSPSLRSLVAVVPFVVAASLPAQAPSPGRVVVGLVDTRALLQQAPGRAQAESEFALEQSKMRAQVREAADSLKSSVEEFTRVEKELRPREREALMMVLRARELAFEDMVSQLNIAVETRLATLQAPLLERIRTAVQVVRRREGVQLVLDAAAMPALLDADATVDLTPKVLEELRRGPR